MKSSSGSIKFQVETLRAIALGLTIPFGNNMLIYLCGIEMQFDFIKAIQFLLSIFFVYAANQIIGYAKDLIDKKGN